MQRNNRVALLAHCVLNQNSVIKGWARARGGFPEVIQIIITEGIGMIQLPCPEQTFLGSTRPPMTVEQYDIDDYRYHCRRLLEGIVEGLIEYQKNGVELVGLVGIENSPSCCGNKGIFYQELQYQLMERGLELDLVQVPSNHNERAHNQDFIEALQKWAK